MNHRYRVRGAFSLVEVTLALVVAAFSLIAIMGLLPIGLKTNQDAMQQTIANGILSAVVSDIRTTPKGANQSSRQFRITFPNNRNRPGYLFFGIDGSAALRIDHPDSDSVFYVIISYCNPPLGAGASTATLLEVKVFWPYAGVFPPDQGPAPSGSIETILSLDRN